MKWIVVGICGVTNGGKTTLAMSLEEQMQRYFVDIKIMHMDNYWKSGNHDNWETLDAVNTDGLMEDVNKNLQIGSLDNDPNSKSLLIIEGILIFNHKPILELCDIKFYIDLPYEICLKRRQKREYLIPLTLDYFNQYVWPMYKKNRSEFEHLTNEIYFLDGTISQVDLLKYVLAKMLSLIN